MGKGKTSYKKQLRDKEHRFENQAQRNGAALGNRAVVIPPPLKPAQPVARKKLASKE